MSLRPTTGHLRYRSLSMNSALSSCIVFIYTMITLCCFAIAYLFVQSTALARDTVFYEEKVRFLELVTDSPILKAKLRTARNILETMPEDSSVFASDTEIDAFRVLLHTLLNQYMLSKSPEEKAEFLKMMHLGIVRGMDTTSAFANDPPLYVKTIMIKEVNLTKTLVEAGRRFITQEFIARSRKMSRALSILYSMPAEIVPPAKLLLTIEKLTSPSSNTAATNPFYNENRTIFATTLLKNARLDSQSAIKPTELLLFSHHYHSLLDRILSETPAKAKMIATKDISRSLDELGNVILQAKIDAMRSDSRSSVSFEHFFDLHVIADEKQRNLFQYICMGRSTVMLDTIMAAFLSPWDEEEGGEVRQMVADRLLFGLTQQHDTRHHTALSYCRMRYGRNQEDDDISGKMWSFIAVLKRALSEESADRYSFLTPDYLFQFPLNNSTVNLSVTQSTIAEVDIDGTIPTIKVQSQEPTSTPIIDSPSTKDDLSSTLPSGEVSDSSSGGWSNERLDLSSFPHIRIGSCDILEESNQPLPFGTEFFQLYINTGTPVIFRQVMHDPTRTVMSRLKEVLKRSTFLKIYGSRKVSASILPYGDSFGVEVTVKSLKQVAKANSLPSFTQSRQESPNNTDSSISLLPLYVFGVPGNDWAKRFMAEVPIPEPLLTDQNATAPAYGVQLQYYLGAAGTGAPVHYHGPALNSLAYGEKHWVLFPPDYGFYSTIPAGRYFTMGPFEDTHPQSIDDSRWKRGLQCTQQAGDVLFVPALWSHGTLNLRQSIGVAHEFSVESFAME